MHEETVRGEMIAEHLRSQGRLQEEDVEDFFDGPLSPKPRLAESARQAREYSLRIARRVALDSRGTPKHVAA